MNNEQTNTTALNATATTPIMREDAPALVKKIGKTTYKVRVHLFQHHQHRNHERQNQAHAVK